MRIARMIASLFLAAFLLLLPCLLLIDHAVPVFGYSFHVVQTGAMIPEIMVNDVVIVRRCKPEDVQLHDIIVYTRSYYYPPVAMPGRVMQVITELYGEQGFWFAAFGNQSNITPEHWEPFPAKQIIGKVTGRLPGMGVAIGFMRTGLGTLITLLVCWAAAAMIVVPVLRKRRKKAQP